MLLDQVLEKQRKQIQKLQQTPVGNLREEIEDLRNRLLEQGAAIKELQKPDSGAGTRTNTKTNTVFTEIECESDNFTDTDKEILEIIQDALDGEVPPMPAKITPESGVRALGLPIPLELKDRLVEQQGRYNIESYKASVMTCIRIGVRILETSLPEELENLEEEEIEVPQVAVR